VLADRDEIGRTKEGESLYQTAGRLGMPPHFILIRNDLIHNTRRLCSLREQKLLLRQLLHWLKVSFC